MEDAPLDPGLEDLAQGIQAQLHALRRQALQLSDCLEVMLHATSLMRKMLACSAHTWEAIPCPVRRGVLSIIIGMLPPFP